MTDWLDDDGYPTDWTLDTVRYWPTPGPGETYLPLLQLVGSIWRYGMWGRRLHATGDAWEFTCSTGGWSGNEDLIAALQENQVFWLICWLQSRRGGHYIFEVRNWRGE